MGMYGGEGREEIAFGILTGPDGKKLDEITRLKITALLGKGVTYGVRVELTPKNIEGLTTTD